MTTYSIRRNVPSATSYMYDKVPRVVNVRESISSFERKNLNATTLIFATKGRRPINKEPNNYYNVNCGFLCIYTNLTILGKAQNTDYDSGSKRAPESGRSTLYPYPNKSSNSRYHFTVSRNTQLQHRKGRLSSKSSKPDSTPSKFVTTGCHILSGQLLAYEIVARLLSWSRHHNVVTPVVLRPNGDGSSMSARIHDLRKNGVFEMLFSLDFYVRLTFTCERAQILFNKHYSVIKAKKAIANKLYYMLLV